MKPRSRRNDRARTLAQENTPPWLLLLLSLPANRNSERVQVWRQLKRIGALPLGTSGYLLPNNAINEERAQWLATTIRGYKGSASVVQVQAIDQLPRQEIVERFNSARSQEYQELIESVSKIQKRKTPASQLANARRRFEEIVEIDFFGCALRHRAEQLLARGDLPIHSEMNRKRKSQPVKLSEFQNRVWLTRPRPGIDRVGSAWLIRRFIDRHAKFAFAMSVSETPHAVPFDMFEGKGFSHLGDDCTFETLFKEFAIRHPKVKVLAQMVHDADLHDGKFGRSEALTLDAVLKGWVEARVDDPELLRRGIELFEGLFRNLKSPS